MSSPNRMEEVEDSLETSYITLDFGPAVPQKILGTDLDIRFTGLDTETPFIQIGKLFYRGEWAELIGTEMIVEKKEGGESKVIGMTRRRLMLEPVILKRKKKP